MDSNVKEFYKRAAGYIAPERIYTDPLRRMAWGTDASFYRLTPQLVVRAAGEDEVRRLMADCHELGVAVTFRAAGTSLSGQSVTDSVLIVASQGWDQYHLSPDRSTITLQPGIVGSRVNDILRPHGLCFTPDPASINSAMVGGIVSNNASGMSCGTHANSDRMLVSARIVLADGTVLDTGSPASCNAFRASHPDFVKAVEKLRDDVRGDAELTSRIRHKYSIKNVTGLNIRPLVEFDDPFDIIAHCMVGSEGTLAFLSEVTMATARLKPFKASAMVYFDDLAEACRAVVALREAPVASAEMLDSKSLDSVNDPTGRGLTAVLTESQADSAEELRANIASITGTLGGFRLFRPVEFTDDPTVYGEFWKIRAGIFPSVGGTRPRGTTVLIEDIAFHIDDLPAATVELQQLLVEEGYDDACIYGHALAGNYHFIIAQSFDCDEEVERYKHLMKRVEELVVDRYDGSLKAEHGTGRNMAPFVKKEWGDKAYDVMRRLKAIFDPKGLLNPGVIFNDDADCYVKNLKPMPLTDPVVDRCIECGFCEVNCVSCGLTLSSRQRIAMQRVMAHLRESGGDTRLLAALEKSYRYEGVETCAGDGLCSTSCPMKINTGELTHHLRQRALPAGSAGYRLGRAAAEHLGGVLSTMRPLLSVAGGVKKIIGDGAVDSLGKALHHLGAPLWSHALPAGYRYRPQSTPPSKLKVVYYPSCINRTMGPSAGSSERPLVEVVTSLCRKAGYEVIFADDIDDKCCGMIWSSKGMPDIALEKSRALETVLLKASDGGRLPVICDQSPCLHHMQQTFETLRPVELLEFVADKLAPRLDFHRVDTPVALHVTCSSRLMGLTDKIVGLAARCSTRVLVPAGIGCCGFAGDRGFFYPELNAHALSTLAGQVKAFGAVEGFSNSRTCEIGLTTNSGISYKSLVYLVDRVTTAKSDNQ